MAEQYQAVVNKAGEYRMITGIGTVPVGYKKVGDPAARGKVLDYIEEVWTDATKAQIAELRKS